MLAFLGFLPQESQGPRGTGLGILGCHANVGLLQGNRTEVISEVVKALLRIHLESWFGFHRFSPKPHPSQVTCHNHDVCSIILKSQAYSTRDGIWGYCGKRAVYTNEYANLCI